ncbi:peptide chain release factor N(5)-glutamine methyltransferase [Oscillochloris sp. ZM17-4]|uniref:peptide chain release factor N(5)-glutamine methyltransferase n=1 Tax=Oscillochloris sp. ZM17-4 TaxID=2866714 RepID=UPI001C73A206|nr:peptide chain release factor N(5)-glutamine methyltransferase [Oscillochloris sp. ZM17-4]MBX0327082.1 peptide chain release factor N(5)-glutamine methyltransferase [Oscillochloris sp. ZM17-4]
MSPTISDLLSGGRSRLESASATPRLDAELLLAHLLAWPRARMLAEREYPVASELADTFSGLVARRAGGEPVAYIVGHKEFYGLELAVDRRVLVPRPETELLVELALAAAGRMAAGRADPLRIADIGTGSGAIAVALGVSLPESQIDAVDISAEALEVARANVARHGLAERVRLLRGDLLAPLEGRYDLIVSNPPYTILAEVEPNVYAHEPHLALAGGGPAGADIYRQIFASATERLRPGGALLCEIGAWQGALVADMARAAFPAGEVRVARDLAGHDRVVSVAAAT